MSPGPGGIPTKRESSDQNRPVYALTNRSKKNAGDFLIHKRSRELIMREKGVPASALTTMRGWRLLNADKVNQHKALIICGGPALDRNFYPTIYPLVRNIRSIKVPIFLLGVGAPALKTDPRQLSLSKQSLTVLKYAVDTGGGISVRDPVTSDLLAKYKIPHSITGCPVYFHPHSGPFYKAATTSPRVVFTPGFLHIDPALTQYHRKLLAALRREFTDLTVSFHRGKGPELNTEHVSVMDVTGSADKMEAYQNYDLHVGFRVHAHIWFMSTGRPSVLIPSDVRGIGANQLLGLHFQTLWRNVPVDSIIQMLRKELCFDAPSIQKGLSKVNALKEKMTEFVARIPDA